ncbi:MAG: hypothetical protein LBC18_03155 [Opitutaceae bacterium]|jgi:hypothetical protein|nr:hypothetical protein [Opitutaceae bacterium]
MSKTTTKEERTARSQIVRLYAASCKIGQPDNEELRFRALLQWGSLFRSGAPDTGAPDEEKLRDRAYCVRLYESNAEIKFPTDADVAFRKKLHLEIYNVFGLAKLKDHMEKAEAERAAARSAAATKANQTRAAAQKGGEK